MERHPCQLLLRAAAVAALWLVALGPRAATMPVATVIEGNQEGALFGWSVAGVDDVNADGYDDVLVGAPNWTDGQTREGAVFVYLGSATGYAPTPWWSFQSDQAGANLGWAVALAGDVNGDGRPDVVVGAPGYTNGQAAEGRVYLFLNSASGFPSTPSWTYESNQAEAWLGHSVCGSVGVNGSYGTWNGDAFADIAAGAPGWDGVGPGDGRVLVFYGSSAGPGPLPGWSFTLDQAGAEFGYSAASAGDVNGDGNLDFLAGGMLYDTLTYVDAGRVVGFHGSSSGLAPLPSWVIDGDADLYYMGGAVSTAGDLDRDGYEDVVLSGWARVVGEYTVGGACFFLGSHSGLANTPDIVEFTYQPEAFYGGSLAAVGNFDADPRPEVAIGAYLHDHVEVLPVADVGQVQVAALLGSGMDDPKASAEGTQARDMFSQSVGRAGNVNGDSYDDLVVGAPWFSNGQHHEGAIYLYFGAASYSGGS